MLDPISSRIRFETSLHSRTEPPDILFAAQINSVALTHFRQGVDYGKKLGRNLYLYIKPFFALQLQGGDLLYGKHSYDSKLGVSCPILGRYSSYKPYKVIGVKCFPPKERRMEL